MISLYRLRKVVYVSNRPTNSMDPFVYFVNIVYLPSDPGANRIATLVTTKTHLCDSSIMSSPKAPFYISQLCTLLVCLSVCLSVVCLSWCSRLIISLWYQSQERTCLSAVERRVTLCILFLSAVQNISHAVITTTSSIHRAYRVYNRRWR